MAAPFITPAALAEIRRLLASEKAKRPVVHVSWERQKADNLRGPNGESVWTRGSEGKWNVFVLDYESSDLKDDPTVKAHGLELSNIFLDRYGRQISNPNLDFEGGAFVLRDKAI